ncbi:MAG: hypothetical protein R2766_06415 [Saprospiraceae bacterium]
MRKNLILSICLFLAVTLQAQNRVVDGNLPMVFLIGENEGEYEQMVASYNTLLFQSVTIRWIKPRSIDSYSFKILKIFQEMKE